MIKKITTLLFTAALCCTSYLSMTSTAGPGASYTNAPNEGNCTNCHSGSLISSGSTWNNLTFTSNFTGNGYIPDSTYTLKVAHTVSGIVKWGFQATILDSATDKLIGTITSATGRVQLNTGSISGSKREYATHNGSSGTSSTSTNSADWTWSWKAPSKIVSAIKVYVVVNATNNNSSDNGDQVFSKVFTIRPSSLLPVAKASTTDAQTCIGSNVSLQGTATNNPTSWIWTLPGATPNTSTQQNPVVKYNSAGNFWAYLTVKNSKGTSLKDSVRISVRTLPTVSISGANKYTLCKGDSVKLISTINANYKYTWTPTGEVTSSIWAKDTGNYIVTVTDLNKCSKSAGPVRINHFPSQKVSITRDVTNDTICFEKPVVITASGGNTFDSFYYYSNAGLFQRTGDNPLSLKLSNSDKIKIKAKDTNKCVTPFSNEFEFVVKPTIGSPAVNCTNKTTASFELTWADVQDALGYNISLDSGKTWIQPSSGLKGLSHKEHGFPSNTDIEVLVKALDKFPCYESAITKVLCGSIPCSPLSYTLDYEKDVCKGDNIHFKIKNLNATSYSFTVDKGKTFKDTVFDITADFTRTYAFELIDSNNLSCPTIKRNATVTVWEIPTLDLATNNPQNIFCEGVPAKFDLTVKGMQEYNYFLNNVSKQKGPNSSWTHTNPVNLDSVWVTVTNGACISTSGKIKLGIKPLPNAKFNYSFSGKTASFNPLDNKNTKYLWDFGDGNTNNSSKTPTHDYATGGATHWVKLTVIDDFGCTSTDSVEITVPASVKNVFGTAGIKVYPQPAGNSFKVDVPAALVGSELKITDLNGRLIYTAVVNKNTVEIPSADMVNGVYLISIRKGEARYNSRIIIQH